MAIDALFDTDLDELEQDEARERFTVTDKSSANWCLRKMQAIKKQANEINELAESELERITTWRDKELESLNRHVEFFETLLTEWHMQKLAEDPKVNKSIKLPYGTLKSRATKDQPNKVDDEALLEHLKEFGETDYIVVKESPAWGEYKKTLRVEVLDGKHVVVDENGQEVPGVSVKVGETTYSVEVSD